MIKVHYDPRTQLRKLREHVEKHLSEAVDPQDRGMFLALLAAIDALLARQGPITTDEVLALMEEFWSIAARKRIPQRLTGSQ